MKKIGFLLVAVLVVLVLADRFGGQRLTDRLMAYLPASLTQGQAGGGGGAGGGAGARRDKAPPLVETVVAREEDMPLRRQTIASVLSQASLSVTSNVQGQVVDRVAAEGADVRKGDVVVRLDPRAAAAEVEKAKATLDRDAANVQSAKDALERQKKLAKSNVATGQSLEDARTALTIAEATMALDRATLDAAEVTLGDTEIRAPFNGRLGAYDVAVGSIVSPGGAIVPLTRMAPVDVMFSLPEGDVAALRQAASQGEVTVGVSPAAAATPAPASGEPVTETGRLTFIDSRIDPLSGTFAAKAELDNKDFALWPGQTVTVDVTLATRKLVAVPTVAVQPAQEGSIVYVVGEDSRIAVRKVKVALTNENLSGLAEGLEAGERVVTEGQINLSDGMAVKDATAGADEAPPGEARPPAATDAPVAIGGAGGEKAAGGTKEAVAGQAVEAAAR